MAGSRPFRPWAPDPRCGESRPFLFYLKGLDQSLSGIKNWRARSRRRRGSVLFQCTRNLDTTKRVLRLVCPRCPHPRYKTQVIRRIKGKKMENSKKYPPVFVATHTIKS